MGRGNFEGERGTHCKVLGHSAIICAKRAELSKMPLVLWAWMGHRNHVRDGDAAILRDIAMATNLGLKLLLTGFL